MFDGGCQRFRPIDWDIRSSCGSRSCNKMNRVKSAAAKNAFIKKVKKEGKMLKCRASGSKVQGMLSRLATKPCPWHVYMYMDDYTLYIEI